MFTVAATPRDVSEPACGQHTRASTKQAFAAAVCAQRALLMLPPRLRVCLMHAVDAPLVPAAMPRRKFAASDATRWCRVCRRQLRRCRHARSTMRHAAHSSHDLRRAACLRAVLPDAQPSLLIARVRRLPPSRAVLSTPRDAGCLMPRRVCRHCLRQVRDARLRASADTRGMPRRLRMHAACPVAPAQPHAPTPRHAATPFCRRATRRCPPPRATFASAASAAPPIALRRRDARLPMRRRAITRRRLIFRSRRRLRATSPQRDMMLMAMPPCRAMLLFAAMP